MRFILRCDLFIIPNLKISVVVSLGELGFFIEAKKKPLCGEHSFKEDEMKVNGAGMKGKVFGCFSFRSHPCFIPCCFPSVTFQRFILTEAI